MIRHIRAIRRVPFLLAVACLATACSGQSLNAPTHSPAIPTLAQITRIRTGAPTESLAATPDRTTVLPGIPTLLPAGTPSPTISVATPPANSLTVVLADTGKTITLQIGNTFTLNLGADYDWKVAIGDARVVSAIPDTVLARGVQGIYRANQAGTTSLSATGNMVCPPDKMCIASVKEFKVQIAVQ